MEYCTSDCININSGFNYQTMCTYVRQQCQQDTVQFIQIYFCIFRNSFMVLLTLGLSIIAGLFEIISYLTDDFLCPCVDQLVLSFGFSQTLAGVTFLAFANGAPDVLTAIIAGNSDSSQTALIPFGSIFGALLFACTFILAKVIFYSPPINQVIGLQGKASQIIIPILFYIGATLLMLVISLVFGQMRWYFAIIFVLLYAIYGVIVIIQQNKKKQNKKSSLISESQKTHSIASVTEMIVSQEKQDQQQAQLPDDGIFAKIKRKYRYILKFIFTWTVPSYSKKDWNIMKVLAQMMLSSAFCLFSQQKIQMSIDHIPVIALVQAFTFIIWLIVYIVCRKEPPKYLWIFQIYSFIIVVVWISYVCAILINVLELFQIVTAINPVFIGLTLLAFGNSIGDYFSIVAFAKQGKGMTSIAGVYAGQLFNLLLGLGIGMLLRSVRLGSYPFILFPKLQSLSQAFDDSIIWFVIGMSLIALIVTLVYLLKTKFFFGEKFGYILFIYYIVFCVVTSVIAIMSDVFGKISCDEPII